MYGANESAIKYNGNCRYIRITDIDEFGNLIDNKIMSAQHEDDKYKVELNDLLIARSGATVGKSYLHQDESINAIFAGYLIKFKIDAQKVNPKYIFYYTKLDIYKQWTDAIQRSAGQPNINAEEYKSLDIPLLSNNEQIKIIEIMDNAYKEKAEKEEKVKKLLNGIDNYLLNRLGINFPKVADKEINKSSFSDLIGERIDPYYHKEKFERYEEALKDSPYVVKPIHSIIKELASGSTPCHKNNRSDEIPFIRLTNFKNLNVSMENVINISIDDHKGMLKRSQLKKGDVLFGIAGSIGKIAIYTHEQEANINQAIALLRFDESINNLYITYILDSVLVKFQTDRLQRPVAQPNLNTEELKSILIPLPPNNQKDGFIQDEIAEYINSLRKEAKLLQNEAMDVVEKTKKEVEQIILKGI